MESRTKMTYKVYTTPEFDRLFEELSKKEQDEIDKLTKKELPISPYQGRVDLSFSERKELVEKEFIS